MYQCTRGSQQRKKLLKELASGRQSFSSSPREIRRNVARMFDFKPLSRLTEVEHSLLKKLTFEEVQRVTEQMADNARGVLIGKLKLQPKLRGANRPELLRLFSKGEDFSRNNVVERFSPWFSVNRPLNSYGSRNLQGYEQAGFDVLKWSQEIYKHKGAPIKVLDVGAQTAEMLSDLKQQLGAKVETHALTIDDVPRFNGVDQVHLLPAEHMPVEFQGKFDLIVSNRTLEYTIFPHIALENIAKALAPKGTAVLHWGPGRAHRRKTMDQRLSKFFAAYRKAKFSNLTYDLMKKLEKRALTIEEARKRVQEAIAEWGWEARRTVAWLNAISKLQRSNRYSVKILSRTGGHFGEVPRVIKIKRR